MTLTNYVVHKRDGQKANKNIALFAPTPSPATREVPASRSSSC